MFQINSQSSTNNHNGLTEQALRGRSENTYFITNGNYMDLKTGAALAVTKFSQSLRLCWLEVDVEFCQYLLVAI
ncbi:predicted protein [Botrytis cinerea T4]|uniref:Uncharacterized protein n=1 Tax=Botryotinia fuckeliana (strain T4) TaxID=999810 RepID=G2XQ21_BOTF4|nr:predicted protein [Botrytis cinerea T4]